MTESFQISTDNGEKWLNVECGIADKKEIATEIEFLLIDKQGTHFVFVNWERQEALVFDAANEWETKDYEVGQKYMVKVNS